MRGLAIAVAAACVAFAGASLALAQGPEPASRATLFVAADGTPTIRYAMQSGESAVAFADSTEPTEVARTRFWSFDRSCFALEHGALARRTPECGDPEVKLTWDTVERDRFPPGVVRLANGGALVYTAYLQPLAAGSRRLAPWSVRAPPGGVAAFQAQTSDTTLAIDPRAFALNLAGWVYLGPDRFLDSNSARVLVDDGVPSAIADAMTRIAPRLIEADARALGATPSSRPTLYLTWSDRDGAQRSYQANLAPAGVMRFTLSGNRWADATPEAIASFEGALAHELAHWWNADMFLPAPWAAPWLAEGSAELIGTASLLAIGAIDTTTAGVRVDGAFNECALMASGRAWRDIGERNAGRYPYACGMALQFAVLALAGRREPAVDAFGLWKDIWTAAPRYFEASLAQFLERRGQAEEARELEDTLTGTTTGVALSMRRIFAASGLRTVRNDEIPAHLRSAIARQAMVALMQADCGGNASFYELPDAIAVAPLEGCSHFVPGMTIRSVEGADLMREPLEAVARARSACHAVGAAHLGKTDGTTLSIPCSDALILPTPGALLHFDAEQVAPLLWKGR